jgi:hypothetical protein
MLVLFRICQATRKSFKSPIHPPPSRRHPCPFTVFVVVISRRSDWCLHCTTDPPHEFDARSGCGFQSRDPFNFAGTIALIVSFPVRSFPDFLAIFWWLSGKSTIMRSDWYHWEVEKKRLIDRTPTNIVCPLARLVVRALESRLSCATGDLRSWVGLWAALITSFDWIQDGSYSQIRSLQYWREKKLAKEIAHAPYTRHTLQ